MIEASTTGCGVQLDNPEALLRVLHRLEKKKKENVKGKLTNKLYPASLA